MLTGGCVLDEYSLGAEGDDGVTDAAGEEGVGGAGFLLRLHAKRDDWFMHLGLAAYFEPESDIHGHRGGFHGAAVDPQRDYLRIELG